MPPIERRSATVSLYTGDYESRLRDLANQALAAQRAEDVSGARRHGTKSEAMKLAREYDTLLAEAESAVVTVRVWAISHLQWIDLAGQHPARPDNVDDSRRGVNMDSFPRALLEASLVDPKDVSDFADLQAKGAAALRELDPGRVHYVKLESAAWDVNVGDDALPKSSLVSALRQARDRDSKPQSDSE